MAASPMSGRRTFDRLAKRSYSRSGLWQTCLVLLLCGAALAWVRTLFPAAASGDPSAAPVPEDPLLQALQETASLLAYPELRESWAAARGVDPHTPPVGLTDALGLAIGWNDAAAIHWLEEQADREAPEKGVLFAQGLLYVTQASFAGAGRSFERENALWPAPTARDLALQAFARARDFSAITRLENDPAYRERMDADYLVQVGRAEGNFRRILENFWEHRYGSVQSAPLVVVVLGGLLWMFLLLEIRHQEGRRTYVFPLLAAMGLGIASTWPTLWAAFWMETHLDLLPTGDFTGDLLFYVLSVGLREESCKLLFFLPFLPWLRRRGTELDALLLASAVGLGFAMEENLMWGPSSGRFLSANLLHITFTGLLGLSALRAIRQPGRWFWGFVVMFLGVVFLHGLYNTFLMSALPGLGDVAYFAGTVLALAAFSYFQELAALVPLRGRRFSLTSLYLWAVCLMVVGELFLLCGVTDFHSALLEAGTGALTASMFLFVVVTQFREALAD